MRWTPAVALAFTVKLTLVHVDSGSLSWPPSQAHDKTMHGREPQLDEWLPTVPLEQRNAISLCACRVRVSVCLLTYTMPVWPPRMSMTSSTRAWASWLRLVSDCHCIANACLSLCSIVLRLRHKRIFIRPFCARDAVSVALVRSPTSDPFFALLS